MAPLVGRRVSDHSIDEERKSWRNLPTRLSSVTNIWRPLRFTRSSEGVDWMRPRVSRLETSISEPAWLMIARELAAIAQTGPCAGRGCRPWPRSGRGKAGPGRREAGDGTGPICPSPQERQIFVVLLSDDHAPGADTRCRIVAISRRIGAGLEAVSKPV